MTAIFGVVFALSIDYQVFIVSRVREEWLRTGDAAQAVQVGLARTARVVTGAALSMLGVFLAFGLADVASLRQFGVGLAIAIIIDATLVRLVLLPAALNAAGHWAWWVPGIRVRGRRAGALLVSALRSAVEPGWGAQGPADEFLVTPSRHHLPQPVWARERDRDRAEPTADGTTDERLGGDSSDFGWTDAGWNRSRRRPEPAAGGSSHRASRHAVDAGLPQPARRARGCGQQRAVVDRVLELATEPNAEGETRARARGRAGGAVGADVELRAAGDRLSDRAHGSTARRVAAKARPRRRDDGIEQVQPGADLPTPPSGA